MTLSSSHFGSIDELTFLSLASPVMFSTSSFLLLLPHPSNHLQRFVFLQLFPLQMVLNTKKKKKPLNVKENVRSIYTELF